MIVLYLYSNCPLIVLYSFHERMHVKASCRIVLFFSFSLSLFLLSSGSLLLSSLFSILLSCLVPHLVWILVFCCFFAVLQNACASRLHGKSSAAYGMHACLPVFRIPAGGGRRRSGQRGQPGRILGPAVGGGWGVSVAKRFLGHKNTNLKIRVSCLQRNYLIFACFLALPRPRRCFFERSPPALKTGPRAQNHLRIATPTAKVSESQFLDDVCRTGRFSKLAPSDQKNTGKGGRMPKESYPYS